MKREEFDAIFGDCCFLCKYPENIEVLKFLKSVGMRWVSGDTIKMNDNCAFVDFAVRNSVLTHNYSQYNGRLKDKMYLFRKLNDSFLSEELKKELDKARIMEELNN